MQIREWIDSAADATEHGMFKLRVILKSGNELVVDYDIDGDAFGTDDELTNGNYMIDTRSIAAIEYVRQ